MQMGTALRYDSNVATTEREDSSRNDVVNETFVEWTVPFSLGHKMLLLAGVSVNSMRFSQHSDFGVDALAASAQLRYAPAIRFDSWVFELFHHVSGSDAHSNRRDAARSQTGWLAERNIAFGSRLTFGMDHRRSDARGVVHDVEDIGAFVNWDRRWGKKWLSYVGYRMLRGDVIATGSPRLSLLHVADAIEPEDVLGGVASDIFLYRMKGTSQVMTLGVNYVFSPKWALDFSLRGVYVNAEADNEYFRHLVQGMLLWKIF